MFAFMTFRRLILTALGLMVLVGAAQAQELNESTQRAIKDAVQKVAPSVVQIETSGGTELIGGGAVRKGVGPTTGLAVSPDGYVITSAFNFANKPAGVFVTVPGSNQRFVAKTVCTDQTRMLTLLKIDTPSLPVPTAVPKKEFQIGQWSVALGRALDPSLDRPPSVSVGIISALHRIWGKAVQTDAKVSPVNYGGPLIDVDGRVFGVLVPASPFSEGDTAGVEWYDSGIGFAIPLEDIFAALPRMKQGKDLRKGFLGITAASRDIYSGLSTVGTVAPESTAARAGLKPGDQIIEIDGKAVLNHAQVQHALGPKYEGDTVSLKVKRGSEVKEYTNLVMTGPLTAYVIPFLGILPLRDDPELGVEVRGIVPKGPADLAGIKPGDRIMKIGPATTAPAGPAPPLMQFAGRDQLMSLLATLAPGTELKLELKRKEGGKTETVTARLAVLDPSVLDSLPEKSTAQKALEKVKAPALPPPMIPRPGDPPMPPMPKPRPNVPRPADKPAPPESKDAKDAKEPKKVEKGLLKRTNEARDHEYWVFVPDNYDPNVSHGLVIWLHAAGKGGKDAEDVVKIWEEYCEKHHLILLGPKAENDAGWIASEAEFIAHTARDLMNEYTIDRQRVVAHGMGIGGQMCFYLGFNARDVVRGVATTSAILNNQPKDAAVNQRLSFFIVAGGKDPLAPDIKKGQQTLSDKKYPVIFRQLPEMGREYLDRKTLEELIRWIDTLDRM